MKTISLPKLRLAVKDADAPVPPLKVTMHLAEHARSDYRVMRDATALAEAGFEVTIVDVEKDRTMSVAEDIRGIHLRHIVMPQWYISSRFKPWFFVKFTLMVTRGVIQLLSTEADIYHAHVEKALPACYIAARLRGRPLIFDAPDLTLSDPSIVRWRRLRAISIRLLAHMVGRCATVITASPRYVSELHALYRAPDVTVVRNVPVYQAVPRSQRLREHLGLGPQARIALYQGNVQANRGLDRLVRAAPFLAPDIVLVLMGRAVEPTRSDLEALIASQDVADRVKLLPAVPYAELLDWTASADLGLTIFPPDYSLSIRYTLPNKLFEYLMAGLPVLSSQLDAVADVLQTYEVGRVAPSLAPEDLAAAINAMFADPAALQRMRHNALQAAREEFHWEKEQQHLARLYRHILQTGREVAAPTLVP